MYSSAASSRHARVQSLAEKLYRDRKPELLGIALSNAPSKADAEEALQEALVSFLSHFEPDGPAPPLPWFILTLKRACWAKCSRVHAVSLETPIDGAACEAGLEAVLSNEVEGEFSARIGQRLDARDAMAALKPDERTALVLLGLGYSYKEIMQLQGWTYTKVNRCISEGRAALRRWDSDGLRRK